MKKLSAILILIVIGYGQINPVRILDKALDPIFAKEDSIFIPNQKAEFSNGVNWEIEIVDSAAIYPYNFSSNALALDSVNKPHVVYGRKDQNKIIYAYPIVSGWHKEVVESGLFYYGFSLILDNDDIAHLSYYRKDDALNKTYVCYARRDTAGWLNEAVDSSTGYLGNYFGRFNSSIDLDASHLPGIAYIAWNVADSLHYIKYAHYNGIDWDTSIVARDTTWHHRYPLDYSPSLKFDREGTPHIAFYRIRSDTHTDTLKIAHYDDSLGSWIVDPVLCNIYGGLPVSLALNSQDYPYIAHTVNIGIYCTWWDGTTWHPEYTGVDIGWNDIRIVLDLDSSDNPHIFYHPIGPVEYCYKDSVWHLCGRLDSTMDNMGDISLALDNVDQPHVFFRFSDWDSVGQVNFCGIKYAKGTFVGINEDARYRIQDTRFRLEVYPNPFSKLTNISFDRVHPDRRTHSSYGTSSTERIELKIYDVSGRLIRDFLLSIAYSIVPTVISWDGRDYSGHRVPEGIYFIRLSCDSISITQKVIFLK